MNEGLGVVEVSEIDEVKKKLAAIREQFKKKRKSLRRSQDAYGVVERVNGGFTFRLGNEIENFDKVFGLPD